MNANYEIAVAAVLAGLVAIFVTVAIEKFGGIIGGIIGTVPTTILPAAIFMWVADPRVPVFESAMSMVPAGMLLNAVFLWLWRIIPPIIPDWSFGKRLFSITVINLSVWFTGAALLVALFTMFNPLIIGCVALITGIVFGLWATMEYHPAPTGENEVGILMLAVRGIAAACAIGIAVWFSQHGSPLLAGIASVFPAIFLTSMVALWISQGEDVPSGAVGPMMLGGMSVSLYALLATRLFPEQGVIVGSALAWIASLLLISIPATFWLRLRHNYAVARAH